MGRDPIVQSWVAGGFGSDSFGHWRCVITWANRQPAIASYLRRPDDTEFRVFSIDVLTIDDGQISEIVAFTVDIWDAFGLPPTLDDAFSHEPT
jgi:RNA polymerase sigma-70 factor (ECF subfamily)